MIKYTTLVGDTVERIAYKFQTTQRQLVSDNPTLKNPIPIGMLVNIKTVKEIAMENIGRTMNEVIKKEGKIDKIVSRVQFSNSKMDETGIIFAGVEVAKGQKGIVKWIKDGFIYQLSANDKLDKLDSVKKGDRHRYYRYIEKFGGIYELMGTNAYAKKSDVVIENLDEAIFTQNTKKPEVQRKEDSVESFAIPQFEMPGYKRTRMKVKRADGTYLTIELRITSFVPNYSSQITPSRTNAGWMTQIGGANLTPISISGFVLDTRGNPEARDFMKIYKEVFVPKSDVDYFSAEIVTLLHKSWEYQGLIQGISMVDQAETPLDRKFQMQFLSFTDKPISGEDIKNKFVDVVDRDKKTEPEFRSDLGKMLTNPMTGFYKKDNL